MIPKLTTPPSDYPVTLAQIKAHGVVCESDDDLLLDGLLRAAVSHLDGYSGILGRCIVNQEWSQDFACWAPCLRLPFPDVSAVSVSYVDIDGSDQVVSSSDYEIGADPNGSFVRFGYGFSWPNLNTDRIAPITVTMTAGYGDPKEVPWSLKVAIMQLVAHWYENREATGKAEQVPLAFTALIAPYRRITP